MSGGQVSVPMPIRSPWRRQRAKLSRARPPRAETSGQCTIVAPEPAMISRSRPGRSMPREPDTQVPCGSSTRGDRNPRLSSHSGGLRPCRRDNHLILDQRLAAMQPHRHVELAPRQTPCDAAAPACRFRSRSGASIVRTSPPMTSPPARDRTRSPPPARRGRAPRRNTRRWCRSHPPPGCRCDRRGQDRRAGRARRRCRRRR